LGQPTAPQQRWLRQGKGVYSTREAAKAARLKELRINLAAIEEEIRELEAE
jgi:hypothetical protein